MFEVPVLFIIFNRPDLTARVFESIKDIRPKYLFISADGPRLNVPGDISLCNEARKIVMDNIDWDCEVKILFHEKNQGCSNAPATAITWFFNHVERGIILEDDVLPNKCFFNFCKVLLDRYCNDKKVMHISGNNFLPFGLKESYYFTDYTFVWGWATWKRAWDLYDLEIPEWTKINKSLFLKTKLHHRRAENYWKKKFDLVADSKYRDTWDYQWTYACWTNNGLSIAPAINLVSNIGFRSDATHTHFEKSPLANISTGNLDVLNLVHPKKVEINNEIDRYIRDEIYLGEEPFSIKKYLRQLIKI